MMPAAPLRIQSRDNALFKDFKRLAQDSGAWRRQGRVWAEGECNDVTVTNISDAAITWEIMLELPGTITTAWNTTYSVQGDVGTFSGVDYNATIDPGAAAQFGFCVTY